MDRTSEQSHFPNLEDIGEFRVTNRTFPFVCYALQLPPEDIRALPSQSVVVEVGSGLTQEFARGLGVLRNDLRVFSLDPTLGIDPRNHDITVSIISHHTASIDTADSWKYVDYTVKPRPADADEFDWTEDPRFRRVQALRMRELSKSPGMKVSALIPGLPFQRESVDLLVDCFGPIMYLSRDRAYLYLDEITQVLRPGSCAHFYPIDDISLFKTVYDDNERNCIALARMYEILHHFPCLVPRFYQIPDHLPNKKTPWLSRYDNSSIRPGMILRKKS